MSNCVCIQTRALASQTGAIPSGTTVVVIEQFDTNSAVSHAVYTLFGSTNPNHALSFQNGPNWWVIHPDHVSLEAAGAPPAGASAPTNDCAPAMQNVLQYFGATGNAALKLWERDYVLNNLSSLTTTIPNSGFSIIGKGQTVSRLVVAYGINTGGAIAITFVDSYSQYLLRDFSVVAGNPGSPPAYSGGTAILMHGQGGTGGHQYGGIVERLHIGSEIDSNGNGYGYFTTGLDLKFTARPLVSQTTVGGCEGPFIGEGDFSDTSPVYFMQTGIDIGECYSPTMRDSRVLNAAMGVSCDSPTANPQGFEMSGCNLEGVKTGIYVRHGNASNPAGRIGDSVIQYRDKGLDMGNVVMWTFPNNAFFLQGDDADRGETTAYDMSFIESSCVTITGATFDTFPTGTSNNRVHIGIGSLDPGTGCDHFLIDTCMFGRGGVVAYAATAIQITTTASNVQIGASNFFNGPFTGAVVEDPSSIATTPLGYPASGSSPPSVVPSPANAFSTQPTLGSSLIPWPGTFNKLHYLIETGIPDPGPSFGWVLVSNGNTLWAVQGTTKKQLAP